ncbi:MAG: outer membrane protein assembly factor BamD [FCB group bacterium]|nr:outer membrane protein assembly factor BamD [FCB group bacterium]
MRNRLIYLAISIFLIAGCAGDKAAIEEDLTGRYEKAMKLFEKEKFSQAQIEFEYITMNNPGSKLAVLSEFYLAESLIKQKNYPEAAVEYERYIRYSQDPEKIELARFRVCECAVNSIMSYQKDQSGAITALNRLQEFIEDYPTSDYIPEAEKYIAKIRNDLAKKEYETGRLYLKLEEYDSAIIYFNSVLDQYYDTDYADEARIGIAFAHILNDDIDGAANYLIENKNNFHSVDKYEEGLRLSKDTMDGRLSLREYIRLYR